MQAGLKPTLACANAFATTDFRGDLATLKVPTLIIHGTADKTVPIDTAGRKAAQGIPHAKLIEHDGARRTACSLATKISSWRTYSNFSKPKRYQRVAGSVPLSCRTT